MATRNTTPRTVKDLAPKTDPAGGDIHELPIKNRDRHLHDTPSTNPHVNPGGPLSKIPNHLPKGGGA